jgi:Protein of unknown function (DUF1236)
MKAILLAGVAALTVVMSAASANAQSVGVGVGPVGVGIDFTPEQRTIVREHVQRDRPVTIRENVVVGATIPEDVEIRAVPQSWGPSVTRYRYVYSGDRVYFVEPSTRRVIHVID